MLDNIGIKEINLGCYQEAVLDLHTYDATSQSFTTKLKEHYAVQTVHVRPIPKGKTKVEYTCQFCDEKVELTIRSRRLQNLSYLGAIVVIALAVGLIYWFNQQQIWGNNTFILYCLTVGIGFLVAGTLISQGREDIYISQTSMYSSKYQSGKPKHKILTWQESIQLAETSFESQKPSRKSSSRTQKAGKIKKYTDGWIQEFSDVDRARQQFTNFVKFVEENNPSFPLEIYLAAGTIPISSDNEEGRIWVMYFYDMKYQQDATEFIVEFQKSPLYNSGSDDYMFNSNRQELFYAAVERDKMKILGSHKFSRKRQTKVLSTAKKAQTAWEMHLLKQPVPPEWKSDLLLALNDEDVVARRFAASVLQAFSTPDVADALEIALSDQDPDVRFNAGRSLFHLKGDEARPILEQMLENETNDYVRNNITALISGQSQK